MGGSHCPKRFPAGNVGEAGRSPPQAGVAGQPGPPGSRCAAGVGHHGGTLGSCASPAAGVVELRDSGVVSTLPPRSKGVKRNKQQLKAENQATGADLQRWLKTHRFLRAAPVEQGEPSIALLLSRGAEAGRLSAFTKRLKAGVAGDDQLARWLMNKQLQRSLKPELPTLHYLYWMVDIDVSVGEPLLGTWKAHQRQAVSLASGNEVHRPPRKRAKRESHPRPREKRKREGLAPPPQLQRKARVDNPQAAQLAAAGQAGEPAEPSFSSFFSSSSGSPSSFRAGGPPSGALT
jgi:hypothetical protein